MTVERFIEVVKTLAEMKRYTTETGVITRRAQAALLAKFSLDEQAQLIQGVHAFEANPEAPLGFVFGLLEGDALSKDGVK